MMPEKSAAIGEGLSVSVDDLALLDWVCTDLMSVQDKKGGHKQDYFIMVDCSSSFTWTKRLPCTKTKAITQVLDEYSQMFSGPLYTISSNNEPQYRESNKWLTN